MNDSSQWFVYIAKCADGSLYCGSTTEVKKRIETHNSGKGAKYTKSRLPVRLAWFAPAKSRSDALRKEHDIKKMPRKEKIRLIGL